MPDPLRVAVCGETLFLSVIADGLRAQPDIEVTVVDPQREEALAWVLAFRPHVAVVAHQTAFGLLQLRDVNNNEAREYADFILSLLHQGIPFISLNIQEGSLVVLSEEHRRAESITELVHVIHNLTQGQVYKSLVQKGSF